MNQITREKLIDDSVRVAVSTKRVYGIAYGHLDWLKEINRFPDLTPFSWVCEVRQEFYRLAGAQGNARAC